MKPVLLACIPWNSSHGPKSFVSFAFIHTHRPGSDVLAPGYTRHVLSDWDCDTRPPRAQVLRLTRDGFTRHDVAA